jgi:hypothetical protein
VKAILSMPGCAASDAPRSFAVPGTIIHDAFGKPASWINFASSIAPTAFAQRLETTVFPAASAGASFHAAINNGKFQGII